MSKNKRPSTAMLDNLVYVDYFKRLQEIALNSYEWLNLPPEIDERFLEVVLFEQGYAAFFFDEIANYYLTTQTMIGGNLDIYRIPKWRYAYAVNGYNMQLSDENSVLIFNNYMREPSIRTIELFAQRLTEVERAINVNVVQQKFPIIIKAPESQRLTLKNLFMQWDGNEPFIFGDKSLDTSGIEAIKTDVPYVADKLTLLKMKIWNETLTFLGIENSNTDKKERLTDDETQSGQGGVLSQRHTKLNARKMACKQINAMFGLNVQVQFRKNLEINLETNKPKQKEGEENEQIHNGSTELDGN